MRLFSSLSNVSCIRLILQYFAPDDKQLRKLRDKRMIVRITVRGKVGGRLV